jgi:hypothetical protein
MKAEIIINGTKLTEIQTEVVVRAICALYAASHEAGEKNTVRDLDEILGLIPDLYQAIPQDLDC